MFVNKFDAKFANGSGTGVSIPAIRADDKIALFLDVDGTLIEFADRPDAVIVPPDLPQTLACVERFLGGALALLSGRPIAQLDRLLAPPLLCASGLHGGEMRFGSEAPVILVAGAILDDRVKNQIRDVLTAFPRATLEDKGASLAVHFRQAPEIGKELFAVLARYTAGCARGGLAARGLEVMAGDCVFEIKPGGFDKGSALRAFMRVPPFAGRRPVFIADHPIDQAGFAEAVANGGFGYAVGQEISGTAGCFADPQAVRTWMKQMVV